MNTVKKEDSFMSSDEMLDRRCSWTLACDNALLNRLKKFSADLTRNSREICDDCDSLTKTIKQLDYRLVNVSNEFLMLANSQFLENRVEEFLEFSSSSAVKPPPASSPLLLHPGKSKEDREAELFSKMKLAIQLGLSSCSSERRQRSQAQNRFKMKEPHLIGSPKFFSSKYVGLVEESRRRQQSFQDYNEMEEEVNVVGGQEPPKHLPPKEANQEIKFTMPPTPIFPQRLPENEASTGRVPGGPPSPTISEQSSIFGGGSVGAIAKENYQRVPPASVTDELNKIFGSFAPPPVDDESDDDFRPNAGVGRLFEDDDDDDLFGEKELFPRSKKPDFFFGRANENQLPPAPVLSVPPPLNPDSKKQKEQSVQLSTSYKVNSVEETLVGPQPKTNDTLPSSSPSDDDSLPRSFATAPATARGNADSERVPPELATTATTAAAVPTARPKLPAGAVSAFGGLPPPVVLNKTSLQSAQQTTSTPAAVSTATTTSNTQITCKSEAHDDGRLSPVVRDQQSPAQPQIASSFEKSRNSHGVSTEISSARANPSRAVPVSSLFDESSSDEDIFRSDKRESIKPPSITHSGGNSRGAPHPERIIPKVVAAPREAAQEAKAGKPVKKSIFDESDSEDDLFSGKSKDNLFESKPRKPPIVQRVGKSSSLFGEDSDSDTDLFGNTKRAGSVAVSSVISGKDTPVPGPSRKMGEVQAWNDDDDLFAPEPKTQSKLREESPPIKEIMYNNNEEDHPSDPSILKSSSKDSVTSPSSIIPLPKKEIVKKSIFDESESDDDLFSEKNKSIIGGGGGAVTPPNNSDTTDSVAPVKTILASTKTDNRSSLLFDDSDSSDTDLFGGSKKTSGKDLEEEENAIVIENILEKDACIDTPFVSAAFQDESANVSEKSADEPKSGGKLLGNKISEKIKAMQNSSKVQSSKPSETDPVSAGARKDSKSNVSVKNLALNLNINPLALKFGARPPKLAASAPNTPDQDDDKSSSPDLISAKESSSSSFSPPPLLKVKTAPSSPEKSALIDEISAINTAKLKTVLAEKLAKDKDQPEVIAEPAKVEDLVGILKARVKIQSKRRPPSRTFLKSLATAKPEKEEEEMKDNQEDVPEKSEEVEDVPATPPVFEEREESDSESVLKENSEKILSDTDDKEEGEGNGAKADSSTESV